MRDFNFFSPYLGEKKASRNKNLALFIVVGGLLIFTLGTFLFNYIRISTLNKEIANMDKFINSKENIESAKKSEDYSKKIDIAKKYNSSVDEINSQISKKEVVNSKLLGMINTSLPQSVNFQNMTIDAGNVQINGIAGDRISIAEFQHNLKNLNIFKDLNVISITGNSGGGAKYVFTLKCVLKDVGNYEAN